MDIQKSFGNKIRELRLKQELSQEELAFKSNIHRTYIGCIERGEKNISLKNIYKISKALNIKLKEIFENL